MNQKSEQPSHRPSSRPFNRIVLTGASGKLGSVLREPLRALASTLVLSDIGDLRTPVVEGEEFFRCDLADHAAVKELLTGADLLVHFGGASQELPFAPILQSNIVGQFNVYDNALNCGIKRVVLASSNHVTGYYPAGQQIDAQDAYRPDGLYGVSKGYGELLARFYHDRHGLESVCLRIGSCVVKPKSQRCLAVWLSHGDLIELVRCAATAPTTGFAVVYGVSRNSQSWWKDDDAMRIGYEPRDSADDYREELLITRPGEKPPIWQGGNVLMRDYRKPETLNISPPTPTSPDIGHDC